MHFRSRQTKINKFTMEGIKVLFLLALVLLGTSCCKNKSQKNGNCSACVEGEILFTGFCQQEIQGCQKQEQGNTCKKCYQQFMLKNNKCLGSDELGIPTTLGPFSLSFNKQIIEVEKLYAQISKQYGLEAAFAHAYFMDRNKETKDFSIKQLESLEMKTSKFVAIHYENKKDSSKGIQAMATVTITQTGNQTNQILFKTLQKGQLPVDLSILKKQIESSFGKQLQNFALFDIAITKSTFLIDFISEEFKVKRLTISEAILQGQKVKDQAKIKDISINDYVIQKMVEKYPALKDQKPQILENSDNLLFVVGFGPEITVSASLKNYYFIINPLVNTKVLSQQIFITSNGPLLQPQQNKPTEVLDLKNDASLNQPLSYIFQEFPELLHSTLVNYVLKNNQHQINLVTVPQQFYRIVLNNNENKEGEWKVKQSIKNGKKLYSVSQIKLKKQDQIHLAYGKQFSQSLETITNEQQLSTMQTQYNSEKGEPANFVNNNLLKSQAKTKSVGIQQQKQSLNNNNKLNLVNGNFGSGQTFSLTDFIQASSSPEQYCLDVPNGSFIGKQINKFLNEYAPISGFDVLEGITFDGFYFGVLYSDEDERKIFIKLLQQSTESQLTIDSIEVVNNGYGRLKKQQKMQLIDTLKTQLKDETILDKTTEIYFNGTHYELIVLNQVSKTQNLLLEVLTFRNNPFEIVSKASLLQNNAGQNLPMSFSKKYLLDTSKLSQQDSLIVGQMLSEISFQYLRSNPYIPASTFSELFVLKFAAKEGNTYRILTSSPKQGQYVEITASVVDPGLGLKLRIGSAAMASKKLAFTSIQRVYYKESDFNPCKIQSTTIIEKGINECSECFGEYILLQGYCFSRLEMCTKQLANYCLQCERESYLQDGKCHKIC